MASYQSLDEVIDEEKKISKTIDEIERYANRDYTLRVSVKDGGGYYSIPIPSADIEKLVNEVLSRMYAERLDLTNRIDVALEAINSQPA